VQTNYPIREDVGTRRNMKGSTEIAYFQQRQINMGKAVRHKITVRALSWHAARLSAKSLRCDP